MKLLLKLVLVVVVLVLGAVVAVVFYIDAIARASIERGATYALGVRTTLKEANVGILRGEFSMSGLDVANPEGFEHDYFLSLGDGNVAVTLGSLRRETVELPILALDDITVNLEKKGGKSNYGVIIDNLKGIGSKEPGPDAGDGKKFVIREVVLTNINVEADLFDIGGELNRVTVPIDEIRLTNVGSDGVNTSEVTNVIIRAILAAVMANSAALPLELVNDLGGALAALPALSEMGIETMVDIEGQMTDLTDKTVADLQKQAQQVDKALKDVGKPLEESTKDLGDEVDKALEGLGDLFGNRKDDG